MSDFPLGMVAVSRPREGVPVRRGQVVEVPSARGNPKLFSSPDDWAIRISHGNYHITNHPQDSWDPVPYEEWTVREQVNSILLGDLSEYSWAEPDRSAGDVREEAIFGVLAGIDDELDADVLGWGELLEAIADRIDGLEAANDAAALGRRAWAWRVKKGRDTDLGWVGFKLAEEIGEFAKAVIGEHENRPGRGDPVDEAVDAVTIILAMLSQVRPDVDLFERVAAFLDRSGA